jgi:hypothetical protein
MTPKTPPGQWSQQMLAALFGLSAPAYGRYINALSYPTLQTMQKFEVVLGWPVAEQVQLIPPYWEWPVQDFTRNKTRDTQPRDLRYSMVLRKVVREWAAANPRTELGNEIRQHASIPARAGRHDSRD